MEFSTASFSSASFSVVSFLHLLPQEMDKLCHQGFTVPEILMNLFFQLFNPHF
jgi:hypothetical protein